VTLFFNSLPQNHLGYSAVFLFVSIGFCFLRNIDKKDIGPGYWALSFLGNSIGFFFWSNIIPINELINYGVGELFHIAGFILLICGVYRYAGNEYNKKSLFVLAIWVLYWLIGVISLSKSIYVASIIIKSSRSILFMIGGILLLRDKNENNLKGHLVAGICLIIWAVWILVYAFIKVDKLISFSYGTLVGIQILSAFGLIVMIVESKIKKLEKSEERAEKLEGLLPICSHCKKIRDKEGNWDIIESYIEKRSKAEFSHGICPECLEKHYKKYL